MVGNRLVTVLAIVGCGWLGTAMLRTRDHLERTNRTLLDAQARVDRQTRLLEIAGEVGLHESTVSRAIARKYARTPRGTLPLKAFFASGKRVKPNVR